MNYFIFQNKKQSFDIKFVLLDKINIDSDNYY